LGFFFLGNIKPHPPPPPLTGCGNPQKPGLMGYCVVECPPPPRSPRPPHHTQISQFTPLLLGFAHLCDSTAFLPFFLALSFFPSRLLWGPFTSCANTPHILHKKTTPRLGIFCFDSVSPEFQSKPPSPPRGFYGGFPPPGTRNNIR